MEGTAQFSDAEVHALFDATAMVCPDENCKHEYDDHELSERDENLADGWESGCPGCRQDLEPVPMKVNRLDQFAEARGEMDEHLAMIAGRLPHMRPDLERARAEAEAVVARILGGAL